MKDVPRQTTFAKRNNETRGNFSGSEHVIVFLVLFLQKETGSSLLHESSGIASSISKEKERKKVQVLELFAVFKCQKKFGKKHHIIHLDTCMKY